MSARLVTPSIADFPKFLKGIETRWGLKLKRRFERECLQAKKDRAEKTTKPDRYILSMFPYPSGRLHLGHVRIYTSGDVLTRYSKLMAKNELHPVEYSNVVHPMGFDSFGLPAENAARERSLHPAVWTNSNIRTMKQQLDDLGLQFEWREATSNPSFYKWTQSLFLELFKAGLVYKSFAQVNWDPIDKTVLADEQVDEEGRSWRSGALVEKRYYRQWFVKVNAFTNALYEAKDVDADTWLDILAIQRNWIGKPTGWLFYLPLSHSETNTKDLLPVFTKEPELFYDVNTQLAIADSHWLCGMPEGYEIVNPFSNQPLHITKVSDMDTLPPGANATLICKNPNSSNNSKLMRDQVLLLAKLNNLGGYFTSDKYRDWLISRQRFWGTPIPVTNCDRCGSSAVSENQLPVLLPNIKNLSFDSSQEDKKRYLQDRHKVIAPIEKLAPKEWIETTCQSCGSIARREGETFDTLFDSSWYFLRYATESSNKQPYDKEATRPVWCYIGGKEHASMHLFYARFITHFLHSLGKINFKEPFHSLLVQGVVKSKTYRLNGKYIPKSEAETLIDKNGLVMEFEKMSKSKGNGVDPQELLNMYGADATRFCLMSYANPRSERLWRSHEEEFKDVLIFLRRVTLTVQEYVGIGVQMFNKSEEVAPKIKTLNKQDLRSRQIALKDARNKCTIDAIFNIQETYQFRQYISALHILTTTIRNNSKTPVIYTREFANALASLIVMLNPITPHLSEELWYHFSKAIINPLRLDGGLFKMSMQASDQSWPMPDKDYGRSQCFGAIKQL